MIRIQGIPAVAERLQARIAPTPVCQTFPSQSTRAADPSARAEVQRGIDMGPRTFIQGIPAVKKTPRSLLKAGAGKDFHESELR